MTNENKKWLYFCLGILTAILGWVTYTLYHIFGKPVLPTVKDNLTVDEDAEYEAALKKYPEAVMSLEKKQQKLTSFSLDDPFEISDDTQPIKIEQEITAKDLDDWAEESE